MEKKEISGVEKCLKCSLVYVAHVGKGQKGEREKIVYCMKRPWHLHKLFCIRPDGVLRG